MTTFNVKAIRFNDGQFLTNEIRQINITNELLKTFVDIFSLNSTLSKLPKSLIEKLFEN